MGLQPHPTPHPMADGARQPCAGANRPRPHAGATGNFPGPARGPLTNLPIRAPRGHFAPRRALPGAPLPFKLAAQAGASAVSGGSGRVHQEARFLDSHGFTFAPVQLVVQRVIPSHFFIEAPMEQLPLRLLCRLDAPSVVPPDVIARLPDYRAAVRFCWEQRKRRNLTKTALAEEAGLYAPHVTCYLADPLLKRKHKRDLPGEGIRAFQLACGNTAISQWVAMQGQLTCIEALQAQAIELQRTA